MTIKARTIKEVVTDIDDLIGLSLCDIIPNNELPCDFIIYEEGQEHKVYAASVAHRDILLYSETGVLNYMVDSYGDNHTIELMSIEE
jgi:hypothetical protein